MKQIITFLGTRLEPTAYSFKERSYTGCCFAEVLRQFEDYERMMVFVTPEARANAWPTVEGWGDARIVPVDIPRGESEGELWGIFDKLTEVVGEKDRLVYDITHGLRSIPFLVFLAAAYLKEARGVTLEAIYYGARELRSAERPAPVVDLSPFVRLLDWLAATRQFIATGDACTLAGILQQEGVQHKSDALKHWGENLEQFSLALQLCRPLEVLEEAGQLGERLQQAQPALEQVARPFLLLAPRIREEYVARGLSEPTDRANAEESLRQQLALVLWYLDRNQVIQAMTLAREWLVTAVGWKLGRGCVLDREKRSCLEWGISGLGKVGLPKDEAGTLFTVTDLNDVGQAVWLWPEREKIRNLGAVLSTVRNELDHAGMRPHPLSAQALQKLARGKVWRQLRELAKGWALV